MYALHLYLFVVSSKMENKLSFNFLGKKSCLLRSSLVVHWLKNLALSLLQLGSLLWHRFEPWPGNFHMLWVPSKKKKTKTKTKKQSCLLELKYHIVIMFSKRFRKPHPFRLENRKLPSERRLMLEVKVKKVSQGRRGRMGLSWCRFSSCTWPPARHQCLPFTPASILPLRRRTLRHGKRKLPLS